MKVEKTSIELLSELLKDGNVKITFSKNCISGLVGVLCNCRRCLEGRGREHTFQSEQQAERDSEIAKVAFSNGVRFGSVSKP